MEINHIDIRGAETIINGLEDCIAHLIIGNFERKMRSESNKSNKLIELQLEIDYFNDQMRFPYGQICMMEKNLDSKTNLKLYYAIKNLPGLLFNIDNEIYTQRMIESNLEFKHLWDTAKNLTNNLLFKLKCFERPSAPNIVMSTLVRIIKKGNIDVAKETNECFDAIKQAWQKIWERFNIVRNAFRFITDNSESEFTTALTEVEPPQGTLDYFFLAVDNHQRVRLFAKLGGIKYKARPANRVLKWVKVSELLTDTLPTWWISVIRKPSRNLITIKEESDLDRTFSLSNTTIYNA